MHNIVPEVNLRPEFDQEITDMAAYVCDYSIDSSESYKSASLCLMDALACAFLAIEQPNCQRLMQPIFPHTVAQGARVPGTSYVLDPVQAAFSLGSAIRWLDFNDTWLAAEWGHPSDNLGSILAVADYVSQRRVQDKKPPLLMRDVLSALIKAYEIQGVIALENSFNRVGLDHVVLVKVASTAVVTQLLGGDEATICNALSLAWLDGQSLRTYRHAPNTGTRKSWAAGDATSRAVRLAFLAMAGEMGYPSVLTAKKWGLYDVYFRGNPFTFPRDYGHYVIDNILFKVSFPAEFHAQTAVEAALELHSAVGDRLDDIERVSLETQESAIRIINKRGQLYNAADRDHCLQYMVAVGLIFGELTAEHYEEDVAQDARINTLRNKIEVIENETFSRDYLDPKKRSISNSVQVFFRDGSSTEKITIEYPLGHKRRRDEALPFLKEKFSQGLARCFSEERAKEITSLFVDQAALEKMPVHTFMALLRCP